MSWDQKRQQIADALAGSGGPGWGGFAQSVGAGIKANPLLRWGPQGAAAPEMAGGQAAPASGGLFGGMMQRMQAMPGFNYAPPQAGAAPITARDTGAGAGVPLSQWNRDDRLGLLRGRRTQNNASAFNSMQGPGGGGGIMQGGGGDRGLDAGRSGNTSGGIAGWGGIGGWGGWDGHEGYGQSSSGRRGLY